MEAGINSFFNSFSFDILVPVWSVALLVVVLLLTLFSFIKIRTKLSVKMEYFTRLELSFNESNIANDSLKIDLAKAQKENELSNEKLDWTEKTKLEMQNAFQALARKSLHDNSDEFIKHAKEQFSSLLGQTQSDWKIQKADLHGLVEPLRQNLISVDGYVRELEQKREGAYQGLNEQLNQLNQAQSELRNTTVTLSQALRSSSIRGRWGEIQLKRIVELAGMTSRIDFEEQVHTDDGRPDMIIKLPNGGIIPIDAKAPMESYLDAFSEENQRLKDQKIKDHVKAVKSRISLLSQKQYWKQFENSPEFIIMFVPSEASIIAAFEADNELLESSFSKNVMITTPVTLLALLKVIAYGWQQYHLSENSKKIASEAKEFYKRLEVFTESLEGIGKNLNRTVIDFNKSVGSFQSRLLPIARRFEELEVSGEEIKTPSPIENFPRSH